MTPERGDVLHLTFDPASGREMKGEHYCLVVSARRFNERFKLAIYFHCGGLDLDPRI